MNKEFLIVDNFLNQLEQKGILQFYHIEESFHNPDSQEAIRLIKEFNLVNIITEKENLIKQSVTISREGKKVLNEYTNFESYFIEKNNIKKREKEFEIEIKKTDLKLAKETLKEFPKTKWFARIGFFIAILLMLKELYLLFKK